MVDGLYVVPRRSSSSMTSWGLKMSCPVRAHTAESAARMSWRAVMTAGSAPPSWCVYTVLAIGPAAPQGTARRSGTPISSTRLRRTRSVAMPRKALPYLMCALCVLVPAPGQIVEGGHSFAVMNAEEYVRVTGERCLFGWPHRPGIAGVKLGQHRALCWMRLLKDLRPGPVKAHKYHELIIPLRCGDG